MYWLAVFLGGGLGACARLAIIRFFEVRGTEDIELTQSHSKIPLSSTDVDSALGGSWAESAELAFTKATLISNGVGSLLMGVLFAWLMSAKGLSEGWRVFAMVGFCGSLTTFSTFSLETLQLFLDGKIAMGLIYMILQCVLNVAAASIGFFLLARLIA